MVRTRRSLLAAAVASVSLAGCAGDDGGDTGNGDSTPTATETATPSPTTTAPDEEGMDTTTTDGTGGDQTTAQTTEAGATVAVRAHDDLGDILVGPDGLTLYMFDQDTEGEQASSCSGGCADAWPPLTVDGTPSGSEDVTATLETFEREDGSTQVMGSGWPLYYYASDSSPGDTQGQGVTDSWWVLDPSGEPIRSTGSETTTTGDDDGGIY
jgi:predicted lipoprotein with Yx(FWY)xxD motif